MGRIALATDDNQGLDASLSSHFGRCPYYTFVDVEGSEIKGVSSLANPFYGEHGQPGQVPGFINDQGAEVIIAGGMGYRAMQFFRDFGIEPISGVRGKVREVVDAYLEGRIEGAEPCDESQAHMGLGKGTIPPPEEFKGGEISRLKEEMDDLRSQLTEAQRRLANLERREKSK